MPTAPQSNFQDPDHKKWYQKTGWIIALLILFFPVGLFLMWKYTNWKKPVKGIITALILIIALSGIVSPDKLEQITLKADTEQTYDINQKISIEATTTPSDYELSSSDFKCSGVFSLVNVKNLLVDNWQFIFAILVFLGGGSALSFKVPGAIDIVKSIFSAKDDYRIKHAEAEKAELEVLEKKADLLQKIKDSGINPESLKNPVDALLTGCTTLEVEPIILDDASAANVPLATEVQESPDIEDE